MQEYCLKKLVLSMCEADVAKTTYNRLLRTVAAIKILAERPPLRLKYKRLCMKWSKKYIKTELKTLSYLLTSLKLYQTDLIAGQTDGFLKVMTVLRGCDGNKEVEA